MMPGVIGWGGAPSEGAEATSFPFGAETAGSTCVSNGGASTDGASVPLFVYAATVSAGGAAELSTVSGGSDDLPRNQSGTAIAATTQTPTAKIAAIPMAAFVDRHHEPARK